MWYHNPSERDYSKHSFVDLFQKPIECLEELILLFNSWDTSLPNAGSGMFYLMRELPSGAIYPCREDPHNQNGGYWTSKIPTEKAMEVWKKLCFLMVNETVVEHWQAINGVSITPKQGFCLVKIWNGTDTNSEISQLKTYLSNFLDLNACMYFNNKMKIAIDSRRQGGGRFKKPKQKKQNAFRSSHPQRNSPVVASEKPWNGTWKQLLESQSAKKKPSVDNCYVPPTIKSFKVI